MRNKITHLLTVSCIAVICCGCGTHEQSGGGIVQTIETPPSAATTTATETTTEAVTTTTAAYAERVTKESGTVLIADVPHLTQTRNYATACESLAAVGLLQYYGIDIDTDTFIAQYLPVADYPTLGSDGALHAESPWEFFIGDPARSDGYGCYSGAMEKAINAMMPSLAIVQRNMPLETLCAAYIDRGEPVMLWATIDMAPVQEGHSWFLPDGTWFTFLRPEHALLLIGYDENSYYFSDSLADDAVIAYDRAAVETAYNAMYQQAIVVNTAVLHAASGS